MQNSSICVCVELGELFIFQRYNQCPIVTHRVVYIRLSYDTTIDIGRAIEREKTERALTHTPPPVIPVYFIPE